MLVVNKWNYDYSDARIDEKLQVVLDGWAFKLTEQQLEALLHYIHGTGHYYLTAEAGAGKTVLIDILKAYYDDEMVVCSSTGVGNQNLLQGKGGNGTAHRIWSIPFYLGNNINKAFPPCTGLFAGSDLVEHVIVDEALLLNSEALQVMLMRVKRFNKATRKRKARNIRIMLVGDSCQLPNVVKHENGDMSYLKEHYGSHKMYRSNLWKEFNPTIMVLSQVMRQKDRVFKAALDVLRYGEEDRYEGVLKWINRCVDVSYDPFMFTVGAYKATVDNVNRRVLDANSNPKFTYLANPSGKFNMKEQEIPEEVVLCEGLDCITTINAEDGSFFNGSLCTIEVTEVDGCYVKMHSTGESVFVPLHEYRQEESYVEKNVEQEDGTVKDELKRRVSGTCIQTPLLQASAITSHRAQGKTFEEKGLIDLGVNGFYTRGGDFGCAIGYLALSRFTSIDLITLPRPLTKNHIKVDRDAINFWHECCRQSVI